MGTLTIRNLDDDVKQALRERAAVRGVSMEEEARRTLASSITAEAAGEKRRRPRLEVLRELAVKPKEPFDLKKISDEMWDEGSL
ncbi:FitA-like ribbon-helix-helix domain-containing protein [Mesorhizobium xinjiangense]|uniref:FitA-like ribbon-helix-helix domain-containing protein n=1 Tax=Mesorhizobium xinjiangense TaxID=2678685 RepID=UPI0012ED9F33|nr:hypothetical protein [Mesorhizobium xinjiangense]